LVHVDAIKTKDETILDRVRLIASETDYIKNIHSVYLSALTNQSDSLNDSQKGRNNLHLYLDIQMDPSMDLKQAHGIIDAFEKRVKSEIPEIIDITSHIETEENENLVLGKESKDIDNKYLEAIRKTVLSVPNVADCKNIGLTTLAGETHITLTITINYREKQEMVTLADAHRIATHVQNVVLKQTGASRVIVHTEPM
jgi:divalent metal cation (Fe/Co/Zn/Cd) transporter